MFELAIIYGLLVVLISVTVGSFIVMALNWLNKDIAQRPLLDFPSHPMTRPEWDRTGNERLGYRLDVRMTLAIPVRWSSKMGYHVGGWTPPPGPK